MELLSLAEHIHFKTEEPSQNTDHDMREFLGIDKALYSIQAELVNNTSRLREIDEHINKYNKKSKKKNKGRT